MNRFICCIGFLLSVSVTFAQKVYFIYFETESQQPFFARISDKTLYFFCRRFPDPFKFKRQQLYY